MHEKNADDRRSRKSKGSLMPADLQAYPHILHICELMDMALQNGRTESRIVAADPEHQYNWIGTLGDEVAGTPPTQITPSFGGLSDLDAFCAHHLDRFEAWAELETQPAYGWWDQVDRANKVVSITPNAKPVEMPDDVTRFEQPMPFSRGPYLKRGYGIYALDDTPIAAVAEGSEAEANGNLFAGAWEALTMLHEYVSTDECTDHPEGEQCRFCTSMNVIRRSMGEPDEQVPLLTWFGRFKEQQQIARNYKALHEKREREVNEVIHDIQERIFTLQAKLDRSKAAYPKDAKALAHAIAEISVIKADLEK